MIQRKKGNGKRERTKTNPSAQNIKCLYVPMDLHNYDFNLADQTFMDVVIELA